MDRSSAGKVESTEDKGPAGGVPCPAGDGVIDESGPAEHVDNARQNSASFSDSSNGKCDPENPLIPVCSLN